MAKPAAIEQIKIELFEDDDEFEMDQEWNVEKEEGKEAVQQWEDDWDDDDDVDDGFSLQLRRALDNSSKRS